MAALDTRRRNEALRLRVVDPSSRQVLVSRIAGTTQEPDLSTPTNCDGYGRIRHFRQQVEAGWLRNPLPIVPAAHWLGIAPPEAMSAQVFQLAACAWRCWYCYVPYASMRADLNSSKWFSADALVDAYLALPDRPPIVDLSGGSPDLAPEWIAWMLDAIEARGMSASTFLWSDDNLSSDILNRQPETGLLERIASAPNYARVCCLKGYGAKSFAFNTRAASDGFERQIDVLAEYAASSMDLYLYLPLVGPEDDMAARSQLRRTIDRLSEIREDLPARTVPLFISTFGSMAGRLTADHRRALERQWDLVAFWREVAPPSLLQS